MQPNSHCSWCGQRFADNAPWPRTCTACQNISYLNPKPVTVVLLPVDDGLLVIRRNIPPGVGKPALPGGFMDLGESWQAAGAREVFEETGITIPASGLREFAVRSTPDGHNVLIFALADAVRQADLPLFVPNEETQECLILREPCELVFPLHTEMMRRFFAGRHASAVVT